MLFTLVFNGVFLFIKKVSLCNCAVDNILYANADNIDDLIGMLKEETQKAIDLWKLNQMTVHSKKF